MATIFISIAFLALAAGFYILHSGSRSPQSEVPADHKVKIRKALGPALQVVKDEPPVGLIAMESAALEQEEEDPIDIFLDFDLPLECRLDAQDRLKDAGFTFNSSLTEGIDLDIDSFKNESGVDGHDTATDEGLVPKEVPDGE